MRKRETVFFIDTAITHEVRSSSAGGPRIPLVVHSHPIVNDVGLNKAGWRDFSLEERRTVPDLLLYRTFQYHSAALLVSVSIASRTGMLLL